MPSSKGFLWLSQFDRYRTRSEGNVIRPYFEIFFLVIHFHSNILQHFQLSTKSNDVCLISELIFRHPESLKMAVVSGKNRVGMINFLKPSSIRKHDVNNYIEPSKKTVKNTHIIYSVCLSSPQEWMIEWAKIKFSPVRWRMSQPAKRKLQNINLSVPLCCMEKFQMYDLDSQCRRNKNFQKVLHAVDFAWAPGQVKGKEGGGCGDENGGQVKLLLPHLQDLVGQLSLITCQV